MSENDSLARRLALPARAAMARPGLVIACAGLLVLAAAPGLGMLRLQADGRTLVPPDDPAATADAEIRASFGLRDPIILLVETTHPEGIFNRDTLGAVRALTNAVVAMEGVGPAHVTSLATELRDRVRPGRGTFRTFLDPPPTDAAEMQLLRDDLDGPAARQYTGTLVSADRTAAAIFVGVPPGASSSRSGLTARIEDAVARHRFGRHDRAHVAGAPAAEALLGLHILRDLAVLIPASVAVIAAVVYLGCRSLWGVALGMLEVGACLIVTFGAMGWVGAPIHISTAVLPVVLVTVALTDEVHLFWHYQRELAAWDGRGSHLAVIDRTIRGVARPLTVASLTTTIGFLSFLGSSIEPIRAFGAWAAFGLTFSLLWSITLLPASLALIGPRAFAERARRGAGLGDRAAAALEAPIRRRGVALTLSALLLLAAVPGVFRLRVQDSWIRNFAPGSPFRLASARVDHVLHGSHLLLIHLGLDPRGRGDRPLLRPDALGRIRALEAHIRAQPGVGGTSGLATALDSLAHFWGLDRPGSALTAREARKLLARFGAIRGEERLRALIDATGTETILTVFLKDANYEATERLMGAVRRFRDADPASRDLRIRFCGDVALSQAMIPAVVRSQVSSLGLDLAIVAALLLGFYRSPRFALLAMLPTLATIAVLFGAMGWAGVPLGVATSMFCVIILGVGVDYAVYLLDALERMQAPGRPESAALAVRAVGPAIATDVAALALGFGCLVFSRVPTNARLGLILFGGMTCCCLATLGGLGALLAGPARAAGAPARVPDEARPPLPGPEG